MPNASLVIQLLGPPRVTIGGVPLKVDTRKAVAVLAYLVATDRPQAREHLAALLWPDADDASARGALRRTLSALKSGLAGRYLVVERNSVRLEHAGVDADVWQVRAASDAGSAEPAAIEAALRGEFLAGFGLRDAPDFDDWALSEADAWRQRSIAILDRAVERQAAGGMVAAAIEAARRRTELDRLDEGAHRQLMTLYARAGDRAAALRQYRSCVRLLSEELDVEPLPVTTALHEAILAGSLGDAPAPVALKEEAAEDRPAPLPFIGREPDLRVLLHAWRSRDPRLALVEGEAGIGKTRLVAELASTIEGQGGRATELRGYPAHQATPYAPVTDLIEGELRARPETLAALDPATAVEVGRLVPALRPRPGDVPLDGAGAEARFVDALTATVRALAGDLLIVDDAQWIDPASLALVAQVARRSADGRPLVVVCRRPTERTDDPLLPALVEGRRAGWLLAMSLGRLGISEVHDLVESASPGTDADALYAESAGVPFYLAERIAALRGGLGLDVLPTGIRDLVLARLAACAPAAQQVLAAAALIGGAFDPDLVRAVSGRGADETVDALDQLEAHRLVVQRQGSLEVDHELTRSVILDDLGVGRRRLLHRRAAEALIRRPGRLRAPADVAAHLEAAGDAAGAAEWHEAAGTRAADLHAHAEAVDHFEVSLALAPTPDARLHERIAERFMLLGRYADAVRALEAAAANLPPEEAWRPELGLARAHRLLGNLPLAEAHLDAAGPAAGADLSSRTAVEIERARVADRQGREDEAAGHADAALASALERGDPLGIAQAHNVCGLLARHRGELERAKTHLAAALEIAGTLPRPAVRMAALNNLALLELAERSLGPAEAHLRQALTMATTMRDRHHEAALRNNLADVLHVAGRRNEAIGEVALSATILAELGGLGVEDRDPSAEVWRLVDW